MIGKLIWELVGRSLMRLVLVFLAVFLASFLPSTWLVLWLTTASQTYTRGGLLVVALICLIPAAALMGFNYVAYRGIHDIVKQLAFGQKLGAGFVAFIDPSDGMRLPLTDFTSRLKTYLKATRREAEAESHGVKGMAFRAFDGMVFYTARFVLNRIAAGCVVEGQVDLEQFATAVGDRADDLLISYFKKVLWDLTRLALGIGVIVFWILIVLITQLVKLLP